MLFAVISGESRNSGWGSSEKDKEQKCRPTAIAPCEKLCVSVTHEISGLQLGSGYKTIILTPIIRQSETGLQMTICINV